jgi:DNA invertase Pin-like site-specific DNA recombinase
MTQFQMVEPEDTRKRAFRTDEPVYAYIRFSTMEQVKNSLQSKKMQDTRMNEKLVRLGFTDIRVKNKDEGISAQKGLDKRLDLDGIYRAMKAGQCAAIAAYDASRLWRDRDRVYYDDFIVKIKKYNVPVILHNKTYWPDSKSDMESLRAEFEYAQKQLEQQYEKANPARQEAVLGGSYGGHAVPMGYVVAGDKGDRHYVIYEPHAKLIRWLFKRYRQLEGNLGRLGRELVSIDFHFPDFDREALRALGADIPHVALQHTTKGYRLQSRNGLISVLTNRAFIGWYVWNAESEESRVFQGEYVNKESHKAIVELDDFMYAYNRLSSVTLDGEPNENKPAVNRSYSQVNALLDGILTSDGVPCYAMRTGSYVARLNNDGWKSAELVVNIAEIDRAFSGAMRSVLASIKLTRKHHESLNEKVDALIAEQEEKVSTCADTLANIDRAIRQWEVAKQAAMAEESVQDTTEAIRNLKRLRAEREAVEAKQQQATSEKSELKEAGNLIHDAIAAWDRMPFEKRYRLVRLLVGYANIVEASPHILKLTIALIEPVNVVMHCYLWRARGSKSVWTPEENAILRRLYARADRAVILEKLPSRTWESIIMQATNELKLARETRANTSGIPDNFTYADVQLIQYLGMTVKRAVWPHWTMEADMMQVRSLITSTVESCRAAPAKQSG